MKHTILCILGGILFFAFDSNDTANLHLEITNIKSSKGAMMVAIYDSKANFPQGKITIKNRIADVKVGKMFVDIPNIPKGKYAVAIFHDVNDNRKIDKNFIGYPTEPFGFSKNFKPRVSAPKFEDCSIDIVEVKTKCHISLLD